jgi:hypothetical protein
MNRFRSALATTAVAVMAACTTMPRGGTVQAPLGEPFRLAQGETASITGTRLTVRFDSVVSDSRCPVGVQCIRAGEARVGFELRLGGANPQAVILATEGAEPRQAAYDAFDVHLVALEPQPRTDVARPAYVATLRVVRR